jgi:hypothetical protein
MISDSFNTEQLLSLRIAFDNACIELGIGADSADEDRREQLAVMMLSLASGGERDTEVIRAHAVHRMRPPAARSFN